MKKLLWVGDGPDVQSGFGRATREILDRVRHHYDVTVLGINHRGDPGTVPYRDHVYAAAAGGDEFGVGRMTWMCATVKPDVVVIQQDGWWLPYYMAQLRKKKANGEYAYPEIAAIPVVAVVAVDGKNFRGEWLDGVQHAIFWTQFAFDEARKGGYRGKADVIPLGVDLSVYHPVDRSEALGRLLGPQADQLKEKFIVGNVNRNQPRKRFDLTIRFYAEWVRQFGIKDAQLFLHAAPTGDDYVNVAQLASYYGITDQLALNTPLVFYGASEASMNDTYNCFDVQVSTTQGEGMGLTTLEGMACGVPQIVPDWSALGEWAKGAAALVPCTSTMVTMPSLNGSSVIGGVPDEKAFIAALQTLYSDRQHRDAVGRLGLQCTQEDRFRWQVIGQAYVDLLEELLYPTIRTMQVEAVSV